MVLQGDVEQYPTPVPQLTASVILAALQRYDGDLPIRFRSGCGTDVVCVGMRALWWIVVIGVDCDEAILQLGHWKMWTIWKWMTRFHLF
jgi:predicted RNA methylase